MDEKMAVKDAGEDLKQIAATLLETEQSVESRVGARAQAAAADVRDKAKEVVGEIKVRSSAQTVLPRARRCGRKLNDLAFVDCMFFVACARGQTQCAKVAFAVSPQHVHKCSGS